MRAQGTGPVDATVCVAGDPSSIGADLTRVLRTHDLPRRESLFITTLGDELDLELRVLQPKVIVTLGLLAAQRFLGNINLAVVHGLPHAIPFDQVVYPCYSPDSPMTAAVTYDFVGLKHYLAGTLGVKPTNTHPGVYQYAEFAHDLDPDHTLALTVEGTTDHPWGVAYSQRFGEARVLTRDKVASLAVALDDVHEIVLFNALRDLPVLRALGIEVPHFVDVTVLASLLNESLKLSTLAYRHCGLALHTTPIDLDTARREVALHYAGSRANALLRVYATLQLMVGAQGLESLAVRDLAVLLKLDLLRQSGEFVDLTDFTLASSSVWLDD